MRERGEGRRRERGKKADKQTVTGEQERDRGRRGRGKGREEGGEGGTLIEMETPFKNHRCRQLCLSRMRNKSSENNLLSSCCSTADSENEA